MKITAKLHQNNANRINADPHNPLFLMMSQRPTACRFWINIFLRKECFPSFIIWKSISPMWMTIWIKLSSQYLLRLKLKTIYANSWFLTITLVMSTQNTVTEEILVHTSPSTLGKVFCALKSCGINIYDAADLLLNFCLRKVLPWYPHQGVVLQAESLFGKKCGDQVPPTNAMRSVCTNRSCVYPLPQNINI